jgi:hypothetical protein
MQIGIGEWLCRLVRASGCAGWYRWSGCADWYGRVAVQIGVGEWLCRLV